MLKYSVAVVALLAGTSLACAQQPDHGSNNSGAGTSNSASEHAPGQMKDNGSAKESGSAKDLAQGQNKGDGNSAKYQAPGRMKDGSASKSDDKSNEHRSQNETDRSVKTQIGMQKILQIMRKNPITTQRMMPIAIARTPIAMQGTKAHPTIIMVCKRMSSGTNTSRSNFSTGASEGSEGRSGARVPLLT